MPFTPLHMGPGLIVKACMQNSFSLMVFGWTQILIDIQPLVVMLTGKGELHGFSHTYIGASLIALVAALSGKYLGELGLKIIREPQFLPINWPVAFVSAFIGTYSHVFIDSIMHHDIMPLAPFSNVSWLYSVISVNALHVVCLVSAIIGAIGFYLIRRLSRNA